MLPGLLAFLLLLVAGVLAPATADTGSDSKTVGNVVIYLGILPAEMIRGHPKGHPEATMHGGQPGGSGQYHVVIALFDAKSGTRITKADISARVSEIGLAGEEKKLEPMEIAGTETYGNFFRMAGHGPFRISLTIRISDQPQEIKAVFEHRHQ
jgi:hypothetical protein